MTLVELVKLAEEAGAGRNAQLQMADGLPVVGIAVDNGVIYLSDDAERPEVVVPCPRGFNLLRESKRVKR